MQASSLSPLPLSPVQNDPQSDSMHTLGKDLKAEGSLQKSGELKADRSSSFFSDLRTKQENMLKLLQAGGERKREDRTEGGRSGSACRDQLAKSEEDDDLTI